MQLIDTHTHLYLPEFDTDRDDVVKRAVSSNVVKLLMPNIDSQSVDKMLSVESRYPDVCYPMIGLHPTSVKADYLSQLDMIEEEISKRKFIAIGEIGIDLYWDKTFLNEQITSFERQLKLAIKYGLPVAVHSRESFPFVFSSLEKFKGSRLKGVLHAYTGDIDFARKAVTIGFKIGIGGIITFKNSGLDKIALEIGPENIILETDSPYLAPVPYRGKRNESSYICIINKKLAEILGLSEEEVASVTYANSIRLFNL